MDGSRVTQFFKGTCNREMSAALPFNNSYVQMHTNITKNPKSKMSDDCIAGEGAAVYLKPPETELPFNALPHVFYNTLAQVLSDPGVYTWMIIVEDDGSKTFVAAKTLTSIEIHSKHFDLYEAYGQKPVILAGEMMVDAAKNVKYNFLSGTFMMEMMQTNPSGYDEAEFRTAMQSFLLEGGAASAEFSTDSFIPSLVATRDALRLYKNVGYDILKFDTIDDCNYFAKAERGKKPYIDMLKRQYDRQNELMKRAKPNYVPPKDFNTWFTERMEERNLLYKGVKTPRNYFAEGGAIRKTRTRRQRGQRRHRSSKTRKYRR